MNRSDAKKLYGVLEKRVLAGERKADLYAAYLFPVATEDRQHGTPPVRGIERPQQRLLSYRPPAAGSQTERPDIGVSE
jgi:hypothetical protein